MSALKRTLAATAALIFLLAPRTALGDVVMTFDQSTGFSGGTLSYDGAGGPAVGAGIEFDILTVTNGSTTALQCIDCILTFETGANTLESGGLWTWDAGGSFVIEGTVLLADNTEIASGILLAGSFEGIVPASAVLGAGDKLTFSGFGVDQKNEDLLAFFNIANNEFIYANTEITSIGCTPGGTAFNCTVDTADVTNTNVPGGGGGDVPEPGLLALFGLGVLGAVGRHVRQHVLSKTQRG